MQLFLCISFSFLLKLVQTQALPSIGSDSISAPTNLTAASIQQKTYCNRPSVLPWYHADQFAVVDCIAAIRRFPYSTRTGLFHLLPPDDAFLLPEIQGGVQCEVVIDLYGRESAVGGSWKEVREAATMLALACPVHGNVGQTRGGTTRTGSRDGILVAIRKRGREAEAEAGVGGGSGAG